ncbi:MAG: hypothetical protein Q8Q50_03465 [Methylobacter sp.]|nr:hypothetical protein [Methylobacter sp.]
MAFALKKGSSKTRKIDVIAKELGDFDEVISTLKFKAEFTHTGSKQWAVDTDNMTTEELLRDKLVDVTGVKNEDGTPAPFTPELVDALLAESFIANALVQALLVTQGGGKQADWHKQAKLKN